MNIFEELIDELKEQNLLEETVIEINKKLESPAGETSEMVESNALTTGAVPESDHIMPEVPENQPELFGGFEEMESYSESSEEIQAIETDSKVTVLNEVVSYEQQMQSFDPPKAESLSQQINQTEFFRNRANNEVLALQMVDNVLAGVEREVLNVAPKLYDEVPVKKALHEFLQISAKTHTPEHAQAEFLLMQETESWYSALTLRDKNIKVAHLRRFCENSRPALSARALTSMARFYRNAPFSESVRSKFDLILTRIFSKDAGKNKRLLKFTRVELIAQISDLYAEWSSIPLYSMDEDDSDIVLAEMKVEDFMNEVEQATSFDELIKTDFFNRLHIFKENTQENFFAPRVTAVVAEANIRIGNRCVELFEKETAEPEVLEEKYGLLHEQIISEVICKSLDINDIIIKNPVKPAISPVTDQTSPKPDFPADEESVKPQSAGENVVKKSDEKENKLFKVNKWLLVLTVLVVFATGGLYYWVETSANQSAPQGNVKNVNLENSSLKEHIQTARISGDTFYGIILPSWDGLTQEQKQSFMGKVLLVGAEKGFVRVNLMNKQGKSVGFASADKVEVFNP